MKPYFDGEKGQYTYQESAYGKIAHGVMKPGAQSERDTKAQRAAGGAERQETDQGGHLIPHAGGGENSARNLVAQSSNVNQRGVRHTERVALNLSSDENNRVFYGPETYHPAGRERPDAEMITTAVRNEQTGQVDVVYQSMTNAQYADQEAWADEAEKVSMEGPQYEDYLTPEERAQANEVAEYLEENPLEDEIDTLGNWESVSYTDISANQDGEHAAGGLDNSADGSMDSGMDDSMDGGMDGGMDDGMDGGM